MGNEKMAYLPPPPPPAKIGLKKKENELLHGTLGFKAAKLEAVKDGFKEVKYCTVHAEMQPGQIEMTNFSSRIRPSEPGNASVFSFPCGLSSGVTHIMNPKTDKSDSCIFTSRRMERTKKAPV